MLVTLRELLQENRAPRCITATMQQAGHQQGEVVRQKRPHPRHQEEKHQQHHQEYQEQQQVPGLAAACRHRQGRAAISGCPVEAASFFAYSHGTFIVWEIPVFF